MKIYRNNNEIHDIEVDNNTELRQSISGEDLISSRFTVAEKLDLQIGDYIEFKGANYSILDEPQVNKSQNTFTYAVEFKSDLYVLKNVQVMLDGNSEFSLFGDAQDAVSLVISNLNRVYGDGLYYTDFIEDREGKLLNFNNENALASLKRLADEFECELRVHGKKITFREKIGEDRNITFEYKKELQSIERQTVSNGELLTVLYPYGSQRNINSEYGSKRLKIAPLSKNVDVFGTIERSMVFDDTYPRLNGSVSTVSDYHKFTDTSIDFDINDQLLEGMTAKVVFNSGDLAGREYEIGSFKNSTKEIDIIEYTDETDLTTPDNVLKPRVGDKYVLIDIKMPQAYINNAEDELLEKAQEYLDKFSQPNVIYKIAPHYPTLRSLQLDLNLGDIITIQDDDFGISYDARILSLRQKIANPFEYTLEIGNQVTVSYITKVMGDQKDIRNNIYLNEKNVNERFNRIYNSVRQFSKAVHVAMGQFNTDTFYYNNQNRVDYIFILNQEGEKEWYYFIGEDHTKGNWNLADWEFIGDNFELIATTTILAENANIGDWIIQDGQIVSQASYDDNPRVQMDGENGSIELVSQVPAYNEQALQRMTIDSRTGRISARRESTRNQPPASAELSSEGVVATTAGRDALSATLGVTARGSMVGFGRGRLERDFANNPYHFLAGVIGRSTNDDPNGAPAYGGAFWSLKSFGRYKGVERISQSVTNYEVKDFEEVLSCYNTDTLTINLPDNPPEGRTILVKRINSLVDVRCVGKILTSAPQDNKNIKPGDIWQFIYDGQYWLANYQGRSDG